MHVLGLLVVLAFSLSARTQASGSVAARNYGTDNVLELPVDNYRANSFRKRALPPAPIQEELLTRQGHVYMVKVTLGGQPVFLVVDPGAIQTWVATPDFNCLNSEKEPQDLSTCMFGKNMFNPADSTTWQPRTKNKFEVIFANGEFLTGKYGDEQLGIGGLSYTHRPHSTINQIIGLAEEGYWDGDMVTSGTLGLAFSRQPNPRSFLQTLFQQQSIEPVFSLALNRSSSFAPTPGGYLALGGIPNIPTDGSWVQTPILPPLTKAPQAYTIKIDGFDFTPPSGLSSTHRPGGRYISSPHKMVVDSGTSSLRVPPEVAKYIASLFIPEAWQDPDTGSYSVLCDARRPHVGIKIAGTSYYIDRSDLVEPPFPSDSKFCLLEIQPAEGEVFVLGSTWFKNVLVAFDFSNWKDDSSRYRNGVLHIAGRYGLT